MRWAVNVSILFTEVPFLERFARARAAGFGAVEFWWPAGETPADVRAAVAEAGLEVVLINFDGGDLAAGDRGLLSDPERAPRFRENVPVALALAEQLGCTQLNALVGLELAPGRRDEQLALARENVGWAADRAAERGAAVLIEAINTIDNGPYLLHTTRQAAAFIAEVGRPNVRLQYDAYHMQRMEGNLVATIREHLDRIAHVQIADSPGRGEPGTGEINYPFVLAALAELGYARHVALEYVPTTASTEDSFAWLRELEAP